MELKKNGNIITSTQIKKQIDPKWYAIYTNPRAEKQVRDRLLEAGVEVFLPLQKHTGSGATGRNLLKCHYFHLMSL